MNDEVADPFNLFYQLAVIKQFPRSITQAGSFLVTKLNPGRGQLWILVEVFTKPISLAGVTLPMGAVLLRIYLRSDGCPDRESYRHW